MHIPFWGEENRDYYVWELRPELKEAIELLNDKKPEKIYTYTKLPQEIGCNRYNKN
ncbi:hypothetical protein [Heliorestis acidaminivorans]|uniref:hypothetical protein n=1 Tax=Heliorestis acidaminivorans TaxID=553427 RepID=UPI0014796D40|nr:hypothetical protein [Heliorestis acidaminivorans]